jgi:hypothetical protein
MRFCRTPGVRTKSARSTNNKGPHAGAFVIWRRARDSNPRTLSSQRFSRPSLSTAQPALQNLSLTLSTSSLVSSSLLKRRHPSRYSGRPALRPSGQLTAFAVLIRSRRISQPLSQLQNSVITSSTSFPASSSLLKRRHRRKGGYHTRNPQRFNL